MPEKVDLSIVIVNYKTYPYLSDCLNSIYKSQIKTKFDIWVVDNNSEDNSVELIRKNFPKVNLIVNEQNLGFAKANNKAIIKSKGKYVLLLNPDTVFTANILDGLISYMENNGKWAIATCKVLLPGGRLDDACHRGFPTPWNAFCQFSGLANLFASSKKLNGYHLGYQNMDKIHEIDACAGAFMLVRRIAGDRINWLDEDYFWYGEDIDFCYRIKQSKWKIVFIPDYSLIHYKGISSGIKKHSKGLSLADKRTKLMVTRARFDVMRIFYRKHYQAVYPGWITCLIFIVIRLKEFLLLTKYRLNLIS